MPIKQITQYETSDGRKWDSLEWAERIEKLLAVEKFIADLDVDWRDTGPNEIAEMIMNNWKELSEVVEE